MPVNTTASFILKSVELPTVNLLLDAVAMVAVVVVIPVYGKFNPLTGTVKLEFSYISN